MKQNPKSPIQPGGSPLPVFLLFGVLVIVFFGWRAFQSYTVPESQVVAAPHQPLPERRDVVRTTISNEGRGTRARANLLSLFSSDDYPQEALRNNEVGTVVVELDVGRDGLVNACTVISSSGSGSLDRATCNILVERAHFEPARQPDGTPVGDLIKQRVTWALPQ